MISYRKFVVLALDCGVVATTAAAVGFLLDRRTDTNVILALLAFPPAFYFSGMYDEESRLPSQMFFARLIVATVLAMFFAGAATFSIPDLRVARGTFALTQLGVAILLPLWRPLAHRLLHSGIKPKKLAIVGAGAAGIALAKAVHMHRDYAVVGIYDDDETKWGEDVGGYEVSGGSWDVLRATNGDTPDVVAVAITHQKSTQLLRTLLDCRRQGIRVSDMAGVYEDATYRLPVEHLSDSWVAFWSQLYPINAGSRSKSKRAFDIVSAIGVLAFFAVPVLIGAIAVRLSSPGPILYRQRRVGKNGVEFDVLKLRTMNVDAEASSGPVWANTKDPRVTWVGNILRRSRLDEVPQLWNVLRGDMSLVGPRPERPMFVRMLAEQIPYYELRHMVKPGLTGWAQVCYPYGASVEDSRAKLEYDLYYIRHFGFIFDLRIALKTVQVLLFSRGSR